MSKVRVPLFKTSPQRYVTIETDPTTGATVGLNFFGPDGKLVTPEQWDALRAHGDGEYRTTDDMDEGAINLYYTDARVDARILAHRFTFTQATASANWNVAHNLATHPAVTVVDSAGSQVFGGITYTDDDNLVLHFGAPFAGVAYLF